LFGIGGIAYIVFEFFIRGHSHWTMFILGGICFILLGLVNQIITWEMPLILQMLIGSAIITTLEFIVGSIVNIRLGWAVWNYSQLPFNYKGQICLKFSMIWFLMSSVGIILDDWARYLFFGEDRPRYKII
jgi:uncharacterized membrane protein